MPRFDQRQQLGFSLLRYLLALLVGIHGWYRILHGDLPTFAASLSDNASFGMALAMAITALQAVGAILLACNRLVWPLCLVFAAFYVAAILLHHLPYGWFTSGAKVDGMEFSVMRTILFLCLAWQYVPSKQAAPQS